MKFVKMHGCGNDYIYINLFCELVQDKSLFAKQSSDRHFGIGGDGVIFISPSTIADFKMEIFNADGSFAEMCGNGIRCATIFARKEHILPPNQNFIAIETFSSIKYVEILDEHTLKVNMGKATVKQDSFIIHSSNNTSLRTYFYDITYVSLDNPHCVIFTEDVEHIDLEHIGPLIEHHEKFPNRTNVEFVQVITPTLLKMRVWERGSGETLACGTGCCAALVAGIKNNLTEAKVTVQVPGGELFIEYDTHTEEIFLTGPAVIVFEGEILE